MKLGLKRFLFLVFLSLPFCGFATHIVGGCITYVHVADSTYIVTLKLYRDCSPGTSPMPDTVTISVLGYNGAPFTPSRDIKIPLTSITPVPANLDSCNSAPNPLPCTQEGLFTMTVHNLPPNPGGYHFYFQLIARNWSLTNVNATGNSVGESFYAYIPGPPVIWGEDFSLTNGTILDNGTTAWTTTSGTIPPASFGVNNNQFQISGANDAQQTWTSQVIPIASYPAGVDVTVDLSENGTLDPNDTIFVYYSLNGGPLTLFSTNGFVADDFGALEASQNGLIGNTIQFVIQVHYDANSPNSEIYHFDNLFLGGTAFLNNSNPSFNLFPPLFLCVGEPFTFDHSATDLDGDSLSYQFYTPFDGDNGPGPLDPTFPNNTVTFQPITFLSGFSTLNPLGGSPLNLNVNTGLLSGTPAALGQYVVGILVKEYRNGVYISSTYRDFQFNVINCPQFVPASLNPITSCNSNIITFANAAGGTSPGWLWNFGDPSTLADSSLLTAPTYVYSQAGTYTISLSTGVGTPCANTATTQLVISSVIPNFTFTAPQCFGNAVIFTDATTHSTNTTLNSWKWKFGDATTSTAQNPTHTYANPGTYIVTLLVGSSTNCSDSIKLPVTIYPIPTLNAQSSSVLCDGGLTPFHAFVSSVSGATISWTNSNSSIGLQASGTGNIPSFNVTNTSAAIQVANISVQATSNGCAGPAQNFSITVNPKPSISSPPNQIVCDGVIVPATNLISTPPGATYAWSNSNSAIGLAGNGTGNVPLFVASNVSVTPKLGNITITPSLNTCVGASVSYSITVKATPAMITPTNQNVCSGTVLSGIVFTSTPAGASFSWTNTNPSIGLASTGTDSIPAFITSNVGSSLLIGTVSITPVLNGCFGNVSSYNITVKPIPSFVAPPNQTICPGQNIPAVNLISNPPGSIFTWVNNNTSIGLGAGGSGAIPAFNSTNSGGTQLTASIAISISLNACVGIAQSYAISVNPKPVLDPLVDQTLCAGASSNPTAFNSSPAGASFNWINGNTNIGLASSGTGDIVSFTATNNTHTVLNSIVIVTPQLNGCIGNTQSFIIHINPLPEVIVQPNSTVCEGALVSTLNFISLPQGASFDWSNTNPAIGLGAAGIGNITAFTASNTLSTAISGAITVTPTLNTCIGSSKSFTITVQPRATVTVPSDISVCADELISLTSFTGIPSASTFSWTNTNPAIGLVASGIGDVPAFTSTNSGASSQVGIVTVIPVFQGCSGNPASYKISVKATPKADFTYTPNPTTILNSAVFFTETCQFASTYHWDFGDGNTGNSANEMHVYQDSGCFPVQLISKNLDGCVDTAYHLVCINGDFVIYIPNAFTPDGDGINDSFFPRGVGIAPLNYELLIFDRWGLLIFKSNLLEKGWDGSTANLISKGPAVIDTYVYKLHCEDIFRKAHDFIGQVTLLK